MIAPIAVWRTTACFIASPVGMRHTESGTTAGGRDKRLRANRRYGVVVVDVFACLARGRSAAHTAYVLILPHFCRAAGLQRRWTA